jgi:hypothetical protein
LSQLKASNCTMSIYESVFFHSFFILKFVAYKNHFSICIFEISSN